jgi:hypothetical protein
MKPRLCNVHFETAPDWFISADGDIGPNVCSGIVLVVNARVPLVGRDAEDTPQAVDRLIAALEEWRDELNKKGQG